MEYKYSFHGKDSLVDIISALCAVVLRNSQGNGEYQLEDHVHRCEKKISTWISQKTNFQSEDLIILFSETFPIHFPSLSQSPTSQPCTRCTANAARWSSTAHTSCGRNRTLCLGTILMWHPQNVWGFWTPSPCLHLGPIYITKSTQPTLHRLHGHYHRPQEMGGGGGE